MVTCRFISGPNPIVSWLCAMEWFGNVKGKIQEEIDVIFYQFPTDDANWWVVKSKIFRNKADVLDN
jgi:hypothetical protein